MNTNEAPTTTLFHAHVELSWTETKSGNPHVIEVEAATEEAVIAEILRDYAKFAKDGEITDAVRAWAASQVCEGGF